MYWMKDPRFNTTDRKNGKMVKMVYIHPCRQSNIMVKQRKIGWCYVKMSHSTKCEKNYAFFLHEDSSINLKLKYINKLNVELYV